MFATINVIIRWILSFAIAASMQMGMTDATQVSPQQVAQDFMAGITTAQEETMDRYSGNAYVNFMVNLDGEKKTVKRMRKALLKNLEYKIVGIEERDGVAVARVDIKQCNFSKVLDKYEDEAYLYITEHIYDEDITDKDKLNDKCLDIYVSQIEKVAKAGKTRDHSIYLIMKDNGYNGWKIRLDDDTMKKLLGNLAIPEGGLDNDKKDK